ncbi:ATP-binding protein [candidate division KSB1 bacterium]
MVKLVTSFIRIVYQKISTRLFIILLLVLVALFSFYTYFIINTQTNYSMQNVIASADRASNVIKSSTRYSMLLNRKEDVHQIIRTLGKITGFDGIRIYNKAGEVIFSTNEEEMGHKVNMNAEACNICHNENSDEVSSTSELATRIFESPSGYRVLGLINPIKNEPDCSNASCHAHPSSQTVLGVLDVKMSLQQVDEIIAENKNQNFIFFIITIFLVALTSAIFIWNVVHVPVNKLIHGTRAVSGGDLDYKILINRKDEIGELAQSFNTMTIDLKKANLEITEWSNTLSERVEMKRKKLLKAQDQIIQYEKMSSLGKLSASVAHEINNPLAGILVYTKLLQRKVHGDSLTNENKAEIEKYLSLIKSETTRCGNIVKNLLLFARQRDQGFAKENLLSIIDKSVQLIDHHLKIKNIEYKQTKPKSPIFISCDANQLQQAFMAFLINAVESMDSEELGILTLDINLIKEKKLIEIRISDTGRGIQDDHIKHIFEPFFTTKQDGKSVGLGLSVAHGIIKRHNGEIVVESKSGIGTTFIINLLVETEPTELKDIYSFD